MNKKELANYLVSRLRTELNVTTHNTNDEVLELARAFIISSYDQGYADAKEEMKDDRKDPFECGRCGLIHEGECGI